jgi:SAM-dependent methyltransferase
MKIADELSSRFERDPSGIFVSGHEGYWSNLTKEENRSLIDGLQTFGASQALLKYQGWLEGVVYSPKRGAGLELLRLKGDETCIDYGCMWGALTVPLAKRTGQVLGIDQTRESLLFLKARAKEENIENVELLCTDLRKLDAFENIADIAVVNGVLEWIPEMGPIALKNYYGQYSEKKYQDSPYTMQKSFLKTVHQHLREGGRLYLAIENRYDFKMFLGKKDPHSNLLWTSFLPRSLANRISHFKLGRPYVNWLYSFAGIESLLKDAGFGRVELYACFPDYRFPEMIIPYDKNLSSYRSLTPFRSPEGRISLRKTIMALAERILFKKLKLKQIAPSIIAVACK